MRVPSGGYICTNILSVVLTFVFGLFTSFFCVLPFMLLILSSDKFLSFIVFCFSHFNFQLFTLAFVFKLLYIVFWLGFSHAISVIKRHLSSPSFFGSRQTYRQTIDSVSDMGRQWK